MPRKIELSNADDYIRRYLSGESVTKLSSKAGINPKIMYRIIREAGIPRRGNRLNIPQLDTILDRYLKGETEQSLALEYAISRPALRRRLLEAGIEPRSISETMYTRWENATPESREAMLSPAHRTAKGKSRTNDFLERCALGRERNQTGISPIETILTDWLRETGFSVTQQKAIGIYNVDIALNKFPVTIEIFGGGYHGTGRHALRFFERTKYLLNSGWSVIIIWVDGRRYPLSIACRDYIVAFVKKLSSDPSLRSQYRVIRGNGENAPIAKSNFNRPTDIKRLCASD